ncbi:DUF3575 domain-containing protein [Taibaiella lutea]|uniref:DUF3575 domain-containing protein n=1 Tax=Taibaiella lutea TaxID=2608001 RepID=A0A5M6CEY7_9BACT|nr:DUF3575 domain-containing protein [Taibaiella lutea]KAA5533543.1 DUF3575 domain-containing protein [Taibaiella lutea]
MNISLVNVKFEAPITMKKTKTIIIFLHLLSANAAHAQVPFSKNHRKPNYTDSWNFSNRIAVKLTPSSLLDPYGALLPVGFEYYPNYKYGISLDFGFPLYYALNNQRFDYHKTINSDFKLRADIRQYFMFRKHNCLFFGAEAFYRNQKMTLQNSYFHFIDNTCYKFSEAKANKDAFGFGLIFGNSYKLANRLLLQGNIGIGFRIINMSPVWDVNVATPYFKGSFVSLELPNEDRVGDHDLNIYIPFAIKLAYCF